MNKASYPTTEHPIIQIIFTRNCHWLVASNAFSGDDEVIVYDSLFTNVTKDTFSLITRLFKRGNISVLQPQKQNGTDDGGLYALAFATSLAYGHDPSTINYNQGMMRKHLIECFENKKMVPFH